ncbi:hypothetical protein HNV12_10165 [Methanococcoides sp. SA1]|nr:hypothetical protein [Methanococcoides sp. SA1]
MLLNMYCKDFDVKKLMRVSQMMIGAGLCFNAVGILVSRYTDGAEFIPGLCFGLGITLIFGAVSYHNKGKMKLK